jgi:hypothetical protein
VLNRDILLVRSCGCTTNHTADARAHSGSNRTANHGTCCTTCDSPAYCASSLSKGEGWENQGSGNKSILQVDTHGCFSV